MYLSLDMLLLKDINDITLTVSWFLKFTLYLSQPEVEFINLVGMLQILFLEDAKGRGLSIKQPSQMV